MRPGFGRKPPRWFTDRLLIALLLAWGFILYRGVCAIVYWTTGYKLPLPE